MSGSTTKQEIGKMVRIDVNVHENLTKLGSKKESYSMIIRRLINFYATNRFGQIHRSSLERGRKGIDKSEGPNCSVK